MVGPLAARGTALALPHLPGECKVSRCRHTARTASSLKKVFGDVRVSLPRTRQPAAVGFDSENESDRDPVISALRPSVGTVRRKGWPE
jgi:hypothetical protein